MQYCLIQGRKIGMIRVQTLMSWIMILEVVSMAIQMRSFRCSSMVVVALVRVEVDLDKVDNPFNSDSEQ
jgi:hypothetical protein